MSELIKLIFAVLYNFTNDGKKTVNLLCLYLQHLYHIYAISIRHTRLRRQRCICIPNYDEILQSTAELKLHCVSKKTSPTFLAITLESIDGFL